jgi:uncharacterized protein (TIGR02246 family)
MVKRLLFALVIASLGGALCAVPAKAAMSDEDKIRALEDKFVAAVNGKDIDAIMSVYVPDESLFVFDLVPPRQYVGAEAYRKNWEGFLNTMTGPVKFEVTDFTVTVAGELAYAHSVHYFTGTDSQGQTTSMIARVSDVYRKIKGQWLIVHEHVSVPVDLQTGKADFASQP